MVTATFRTVAETRSTNEDMANLARDGAAEGSWLRAGRQTGGKGRQGRAWQSPPGNLHASTLVRLQPGDPPAPTLALVAAVAVHEAAAFYAPGIAIKWPNDLLVIPPRTGEGDQPKAGGGVPAKLAGTLLERQSDAVVIGFGVNLAHHPGDLERPVTSLAAQCGKAPDPDAFVHRLAGAFARWLAIWRTKGLGPVREAWLAAAHPVGTPLATSDANGVFEGLDETGSLRLRLEDGSIRVIHAGDVFLV